MNTRARRTQQEYALLKAAEFFRDELQWNEVGLTARQAEKMRELKTLCFGALNDPTVADIHKIEQLYQATKTGD